MHFTIVDTVQVYQWIAIQGTYDQRRYSDLWTAGRPLHSKWGFYHIGIHLVNFTLLPVYTTYIYLAIVYSMLAKYL